MEVLYKILQYHWIVSPTETSSQITLKMRENNVKMLHNFFFVKKLKILYSSDHSILLEFLKFVINKVAKELQMMF